MQNLRREGYEASQFSSCVYSIKGTSLLRLTVGAHVNAIDVNWLTLVVYLFATSLAEIIAYQRHLYIAMPAEVALGTAAVAYPVIYQCCRYLLPQAGRRILALVLAAIFFGFFFGAGIFTPSDDKTLGLSLGMVLLGAGIAMLVVTVGRISLQYSLLSQQCLALAAASIALILSGPLTAPFVVMTVQDLPSIADAILYRLDHLLGLRSLTTFSSMLLMNEHLRWVVGVAYKSLLWPILAAGLSEAIFAPKRAKGLSLRFLIAPCLGFPLYYLVPAIGPAYYHGDLFPFDMPIGQEHP
ncbi:MAG TPA: phosphatase PAP2 family protein, partial [Dongiaceae bacterium]